MKESRRQAFKIHGSLFWEFFKIGLFTIGGGMAMLPLIQKVVVEDRNWLGEEEIEAFNQSDSAFICVCFFGFLCIFGSEICH